MLLIQGCAPDPEDFDERCIACYILHVEIRDEVEIKFSEIRFLLRGSS